MASLYIHIPFCKQACHYCDFHFATGMKQKPRMLKAIGDELEFRKEFLGGEPLQTLYFGGGTPSVLEGDEIDSLLQKVYDLFEVIDTPEITLEANPDDLTQEKLKVLAATPINRLSIGVQSFFQQDLALMNRAHTATEALESIGMAKAYFENISIDLIYGMPQMDITRWRRNLEQTLALDVPHISCYALTVEPKTALERFIATGKLPPLDEAMAEKHYRVLVEYLEAAGYVNYEFSNFGKPGYFSQNNTAYWSGKKYLGVGPSAHSYNGKSRYWNVANNSKYIKTLEQRELPLEEEVLSDADRYNETIMTGLRTQWGVSLEFIRSEFGMLFSDYLESQANGFKAKGLLEEVEGRLLVTPRGKFLSDGIASDLFYVTL